MSRWEKIGAWVFGLFLFGGLFFLIYTSIYHRPVYDEAVYEDEEDLEEYEEEEAVEEEEPAKPAAPAAPPTPAKTKK